MEDGGGASLLPCFVVEGFADEQSREELLASDVFVVAWEDVVIGPRSWFVDCKTLTDGAMLKASLDVSNDFLFC